jgi:hypothetical protein
VVLHGCETWSQTLREEHTEGVWEQGAEENIWSEDEVMEDWRKLHEEELYNLYSLPNIIRMNRSRMRREGHVAQMGVKRNAYRILVGKPEGKRPIRRPIRRPRHR